MYEMMKTLKKIIGLGLAVATVMACNPSGKELKTETFEFADSTAHAHLTIKAELPVAAEGAPAAIRTKLIEVMDRQLSHICTYEQERMFPAFEGNADDSRVLMDYYRGKAFETISTVSQADFDERKQYIDENEELTDDQRKEFLEDMPGWEYDFSLTKTSETDRYVIFLSEDFVFSGGAHGGIIGCGPLTFDKKDGHLVEKFLEESALQEMQPLLRKGLVQYYSSFGQEIQPEQLDENLMLSGDVIPFPAWAPVPTPEGLDFTYQQYEIASYADGMPSFTLPYDEVLPFLTEDAKKLIGK